MACRPCQGIPCDNPPDLAAGIDGAIYSALDYSFEVTCPDKCYCPPGTFPRVISILASTIPPVVPPIAEPSAPIILRLQGCTSLITHTLNSTATQSEIAAAAQSMQAEWAGQQSLCNALLVPGVNCQGAGATSIQVCNDGEDFICPYRGPIIILPNILCETLITTGLTQAQIDAATAQIKANLNENAHNAQCLRAVCSFSVVIAAIGANTTVVIHQHNGSLVASNWDTSRICISVPGVFAPPGACGATGPLAPGGDSITPSINMPVPNPFSITIDGVVIYDVPFPLANTSYTVFMTLNC